MMSEQDQIALSSDIQINDCWNRIGVQGDKSCPLLIDYIHCRNCHVYEAAAAELMNRPLPDAYRQEWAREFSPEQIEEQAGSESALVFRVAAEWLALPTASISEVTDMRAIHSIPHRRDGALLGLTNVRGELVACVSLIQLLGLGSTAPVMQDHRIVPRLLMLRYDGHRVALPVDQVQGTERYHPDQLRPLPATLEQAPHLYCTASLPLETGLAGLLDADLLAKSINRSLA